MTSSNISRSYMRATMQRCLVVSHARIQQAHRLSRTESLMAQLGIRWPVECKTTTTSGSVATRSRLKFLAANSHQHMNSKSTGPTINSRLWNSSRKLIAVFKASFRIRLAAPLKKLRLRLKVATSDSKLQSTASSGEFFFPASTNLRWTFFCFRLKSATELFCHSNLTQPVNPRSSLMASLRAKLNSWWWVSSNSCFDFSPHYLNLFK